MMIDLTEDERNAICAAAGMAIDDQENYLDYGDPLVDYGQEWPEVAQTKAESFQDLAGVLQKLGFIQIAIDAAKLAGRFREVD